MGQQEYFQQALSNFMFDVASGGAIRHLADLGYTVEQIRKHLDFPTPYDRIQKTVWEHLLQTGVLRLQEPGTAKRQEQYEFVTEYDEYGRKSFRRVIKEDKSSREFQISGESKVLRKSRDSRESKASSKPQPAQRFEKEEPVSWKEHIFTETERGGLNACLAELCSANGEESAYISCDFGLRRYREPERYERSLLCLEADDREYVQGLPWERCVVYHRLNRRMRRIVSCLYEAGAFEGTGYFPCRGERLKIGGKILG